MGSSEKASMGSGFYTAKNPPFGGVFNYYLKDGLQSLKEQRKKREKKAIKSKKSVAFESWEKAEQERLEPKPTIWLTVKDNNGNVVRRIEGPTKKGFNQVVWDLRFPSTSAIDKEKDKSKGMMVAPGQYSVTLTEHINGNYRQLSEPQNFEVKRLRTGTLKGAEPEQTVAFWREAAELQGQVSAANKALSTALSRTKQLKLALSRTHTEPGQLDKSLHDITQALHALDVQLNGMGSKNEIGQDGHMTISDRISAAMIGTSLSTYGPTPTHKRSLTIGREEFAGFKTKLNDLLTNKIPAFEKQLQQAGGPWVAGGALPDS